ncbi:MAG: cation diffusion facilitator family transporter [Candidatus Brevundimonas colombiensis]|uniref:Cation diffusion facilitator family transporter n=1 Tax=Candidatus Brevundimonas colombiensis TaxID=3121376 RepID=A0AAJ5WZ35_9CAUL|nr:cation diffusion facilitator family transporter [Brevundimonas sp.]WEK41036.1 MAG: cation diffusion facilitator family transporter [Brevundimonas sp.]
MNAAHDHSSDHDHADHGHDHAEPGRGHSHGHGHSHGPGGHSHGPVDTGDWRYAVGLVVNLIFVACEFGAGLMADSTALLADAGHNLSDVLGLAMAGGAAWLARRGAHGAAGGRRTYGFGKATVLAALGNALLLIFACGAIAFEAVRRFNEPAPVGSATIMVVAGIGFVINLGTALLFMKSQHDLNAKGAYLHMMADAGVSLGVVVAGAVILATGWSVVDPLVSLVIVVVILWSTWGLLKDSVNLAMDGAPSGVDVPVLEKALLDLAGVRAVHDLHVWALSTTETALTAHLVHDRPDSAALIGEAQAAARRQGINHTTLQLENEPLPDCPGC